MTEPETMNRTDARSKGNRVIDGTKKCEEGNHD
jgi:hypothetical protein